MKSILPEKKLIQPRQRTFGRGGRRLRTDPPGQFFSQPRDARPIRLHLDVGPVQSGQQQSGLDQSATGLLQGGLHSQLDGGLMRTSRQAAKPHRTLFHASGFAQVSFGFDLGRGGGEIDPEAKFPESGVCFAELCQSGPSFAPSSIRRLHDHFAIEEAGDSPGLDPHSEVIPIAWEVMFGADFGEDGP